MLTWKIVGTSKPSILYIYIDNLEAFIQARAETKKIQTCSSKDFKGKSENYVMLMSQQLVKRSKNICHAILWWKAKNSASKNSACKEN